MAERTQPAALRPDPATGSKCQHRPRFANSPQINFNRDWIWSSPCPSTNTSARNVTTNSKRWSMARKRQSVRSATRRNLSRSSRCLQFRQRGLRHLNPLQALAEAAEFTRFEPRAFAAGSDYVYCTVGFDVTFRHNGRKLTIDNEMHRFLFEDGKVVEWRGSEDTARVDAAFRAPAT